MFGSIEQPLHWARRLVVTGDLQKRSGGFTEFVSLPFVHMASPICLQRKARRGPTFRETVLMHAVARLAYRGLIDNIQASWVKIGVDGVRQPPQRHEPDRCWTADLPGCPGNTGVAATPTPYVASRTAPRSGVGSPGREPPPSTPPRSVANPMPPPGFPSLVQSDGPSKNTAATGAAPPPQHHSPLKTFPSSTADTSPRPDSSSSPELPSPSHHE